MIIRFKCWCWHNVQVNTVLYAVMDWNVQLRLSVILDYEFDFTLLYDTDV